MARLGENRYGKARVRLSRITRSRIKRIKRPARVQRVDGSCAVAGDFETSFTEADNSKLLPTDTMKNTVYSLARDSSAATIEEFAMELGDYLLSNNPQVSKAAIEIDEKCWERISIDGTPMRRPSSWAVRSYRPCELSVSAMAAGSSHPAWTD